MTIVRVIVFGTSSHIASVCEILQRNFDEVVQIIYPENRQHTDKVQQLRLFGQERHILTTVQPRNDKINAFCHQIRQMDPDIGIVWSYSQIIPKCVLELFPLGLINCHGAYLPNYRGANVLNWVLVHGETETGVTLHYIDEGIDTGDIIAQMKVPISQSDDACTLSLKLNQASNILLEKTWPNISAGMVHATPQRHLQATYYKRRTWKDGEIDWSKPAIMVYNLIRALVRPFPGAFFRTQNRIYTVWQASVYECCLPDAVSGQIVAIDESPGTMKVKTGEGVIEIIEFECEGQPVVPIQHFRVGEVLPLMKR